MGKINIPNFQQIETAPKPVPAGNYDCQISGCETKTPKTGTDDYVAWEFTIVGGDSAGRKVFLNTFLTPKAAWTTKKVVEAAGATFDNTGFLSEDCRNKKVSVAVGIEEYLGNPTNKVGNVAAPKV